MSDALRRIDAAIAWVLRLRLVRAALLFSDHRGGLLAAAVTFRALFAVSAALLLGFSAASIWLSRRSDLWQALLETVDQMVPGLIDTGDGGIIAASDLQNLPTSGITVAGIVSVGALVWALIGAVGNLRAAVRTLAGTRHEGASAVVLRVRDLLFAVSIGVLLAASAVVSFIGSAFADTALRWLGLTDGAAPQLLTWAGTLAVTFALDAVIIAWLFILLSGMRVRVRAVVPGALIGAVGLVVLQQLSGLFVGGADNNVLLSSFASLIALLLWFNLSAQVILIACAFIVVSEEEREDRVGSRFGAETFTQRAVRAAERDLRVAEDALAAARETEREDSARRAERLARAEARSG